MWQNSKTKNLREENKTKKNSNCDKTNKNLREERKTKQKNLKKNQTVTKLKKQDQGNQCQTLKLNLKVRLCNSVIVWLI